MERRGGREHGPLLARPLIGYFGFAAAALVAGASWFSRRVIRTRFETTPDRLARATGVIEGAEPICLNRGSRGVLILHGFGDTPQSVRALAESLHEGGWTVRAPLLRGHGASLHAFTRGRATHWLCDAQRALDELREHSDRIALVGQSMGGALATILAAREDIDAMVLLAPYSRLSRRAARIAVFHRLVSLFVPYLRSRSESSILDPTARSRALGRGVTTPRLMYELSLIVQQAEAAASAVRVPTLVIHSRQDPRVDTGDAEAAFSRLGSAEKVLQWAERSGHVLSVDFDHDWVAAQALRWIDIHARDA